MNDTEELNERQRKFVEYVARGLSVQDAARQAGFSPSYSRKSSRLLQHPKIAEAIAAIRTQARDRAGYNADIAMQEAEDAATFAKLHKNSMALVKARELKMKLAGLLIDRVQEVPLDLRGALEAAKLRIINPQRTITQQGDGTATDPDSPLSAKWRRDN